MQLLSARWTSTTLGADESFLARYGYGRAKRYFVVERDGKRYDSKAIFGVALGYEYPDRGLRSEQRVLGRRSDRGSCPAKAGVQDPTTRAPLTEIVHELVLPQAEVDRFAATLSSDEYLEDERDYKVAVHEVVSRTVCCRDDGGDDFPTCSRHSSSAKLDLAEIGIDGELADWVSSATARRSTV